MKIVIETGKNEAKPYIKKMREAARAVFKREKIYDKHLEISLSFVSLEEIRELNKDYRQIDRATDVLSFPLMENIEELEAEIENYIRMEAEEEEPLGFEIVIGDVVICMDKAIEQAEEYGHSLEREVNYLFTHSILHLLGYDHETDEEREIMRLIEEEIMTKIGLERS